MERSLEGLIAIAKVDRVARGVACDRAAAIDVVAEYAARQRDGIACRITTAVSMTAIHLFLHDMRCFVVDEEFVACHIAVAQGIAAVKASCKRALRKRQGIVRHVPCVGCARDCAARCAIRADLVVSGDGRMCIVNRHILPADIGSARR